MPSFGLCVARPHVCILAGVAASPRFTVWLVVDLFQAGISHIGVRVEPCHPLLKERAAVLYGRRVADDTL